MWLMQLGEVVFGGVGSGLYGMIMFAIVAVFLAGLMVGRTPEYLGKKIEPRSEDGRDRAAGALPVVLFGHGDRERHSGRNKQRPESGPHGSRNPLRFLLGRQQQWQRFAELSANTPFYNLALGIAMWLSRYWLMIPVLAIAGSLAAKRATAVTAGTLPTHAPLFVVVLVGVILMVGALTFLPAIALGPIVEHLLMTGAG